MKIARIFFWLATLSTAIYEVLVTSPWWSGAKHGNYAIFFKLTVPSVLILICAYYALQKKNQNYAVGLPVYLIILQIAILFTIYGTVSGLLP